MDPSNVQVVIHHSPCDDGHAAASIFPLDMIRHGCSPSDAIAVPEVFTLIRGRNVVMVDICFSQAELVQLAHHASKLLVLDHHLTNMRTMMNQTLPQNVHCYFEMNRAGVHCAWDYVNPGEEIPRALHYIGLRDVWRHKENEQALYFTTAFERPHDWAAWAELRKPDVVDAVIAKGAILYRYQQSVLQTMQEAAQRTTYQGNTVVMINGCYPWTSDLGNNLATDARIVVAIWNKRPVGPFMVSFRSRDGDGVDVSKIAEQFGGGGHKHAAAARLAQPPWEVLSDDGIWE